MSVMKTAVPKMDMAWARGAPNSPGFIFLLPVFMTAGLLEP